MEAPSPALPPKLAMRSTVLFFGMVLVCVCGVLFEGFPFSPELSRKLKGANSFVLKGRLRVTGCCPIPTEYMPLKRSIFGIPHQWRP